MQSFAGARRWAAKKSRWHCVAFTYLCAKVLLGVLEAVRPQDERPRVALHFVGRWLRGGDVNLAPFFMHTVQRHHEAMRDTCSAHDNADLIRLIDVALAANIIVIAAASGMRTDRDWLASGVACAADTLDDWKRVNRIAARVERIEIPTTWRRRHMS